jgi:formylglycine-generating enzyme required for sulfatase activity
MKPVSKLMKTARVTSTVCFASLLAASATAQLITIDTVAVGDAGNAPDNTGLGAVSYEYEIGTFEVTNSQYTAFLNAVAATDPHSLYNTGMDTSVHGGITRAGTSGSFTYSVKTGFENKPVNFVSFWDSARFANWLSNGQGSGGTETGVYDLGGVSDPPNGSVTRDTSFGFGTMSEVWVVPSLDEWYKAAYYNGSGGYFEHPTQSNTAPTSTSPNSTNPNSANIFGGPVGTVTDVGGYTLADSPYGTFDQAGNVWEWSDTIAGVGRQQAGASWLNSATAASQNPFPFIDPTPSRDFVDIGFRVSNFAPIPESSAYAAIVGLLGLGLALTRRKGRA